MPQVILITGAFSGLGKATAERLSAQGYSVYGTSRYPGRHLAALNTIPMDVADEQSVCSAIAQVMEREGRIDVVINNAGIGIGGAIENFSPEEARLQFETNFFGLARVTRAVLPYMRERQSGKIINISSIGGLIGLPFQGFYSASKFAVEGFSESLSMELRPFNIKVVVINPGDFKTGFTHNRTFTALDSIGSEYENEFRKAVSIFEKDEQGGCDPVLLARVIQRVIRSENPRYRYVVGRFDQRLMAMIKPILPHRLVEWILMDHYRIRP